MCGETGMWPTRPLMEEPKSLTQVIIKMVEETPNDQELGKKVRELVTDIYGETLEFGQII